MLLPHVAKLLDARLALFAQELGDIVGAKGALAAGPGMFPAAEGLHAGPGAGRRPGPAVAKSHPDLDGIEESFLLVFLLAEEAGGEPVLAAVGQSDGFFEGLDFGDRQHWGEEFLLKEPR